jgi:hypothetical protein
MSSEEVGGFSASQDGQAPQTIADAMAPEPTFEAPVTDGQAETEGAVEEPASFNVDEYGSQMATVTVNGEELQVSVKEALAGYQRQQAFTQGMQEVSGARALQQALENPATRGEALQLINSRYGQAAAQEAAEASAPSDSGERHEQSPMERQLKELSDWRAGIELDETIDKLQSKYGDTFNANEVFEEAIKRGITESHQLETVFQTMKFETMFAQSSATEQAAKANAADNASRQAGAQAAAAAISSGNGIGGGSTAPTPVKYTSFADAAAAAWASHP